MEMHITNMVMKILASKAIKIENANTRQVNAISTEELV